VFTSPPFGSSGLSRANGSGALTQAKTRYPFSIWICPSPKKFAKSLILRSIKPEPKLITTPDRLFRRVLILALATVAIAAVLTLARVAFSADFNLPSAPSLSLTRGGATSIVTYHGQTNFQFILYASSNSTSWNGLLTNLCTSPQMTFSETNRPIRFYKATSLKTPLIYQCSFSGADSGSFMLFARTNDSLALVGYSTSGTHGEFADPLPVGTNNLYAGNFLASRTGTLILTSNSVSGTVTNGPAQSARINGILKPNVGPFQASAGLYSGTYSDACFGTLKAILAADGTFILFVSDNTGVTDGGLIGINSNGSFTVATLRGSHYTGTLNQSSRTITGQYAHGICDGFSPGSFSMSRTEKVF